MKKLVSFFLCAAIISMLFAGCENSTAPEQTSVTTTDAAPATSTAPVSDEPSNLPEDDYIIVSPPQIKKEGKVSIEYLAISMKDEAVSQQVNEALEEFFFWGYFGRNETDATVDGKAEFALIGNRFLSVTRTLTIMEEGAAYPTNELTFQNFDLETGEQGITLVKSVAALSDAFASGKFTQEYPAPVESAQEKVTAALSAMDADALAPVYLVEDGLVLYNAGEGIHATGDYWTFKAPFADIRDIFVPALAALI